MALNDIILVSSTIFTKPAKKIEEIAAGAALVIVQSARAKELVTSPAPAVASKNSSMVAVAVWGDRCCGALCCKYCILCSKLSA